MGDLARRWGSVALAAAATATILGSTVGACSSEPQDPADQRRDLVQERLEDSFSSQQSDCIVSALDQDAIDALAQEEDLPSDTSEMQTFSDAIAVCVLSSSAISTTTAAPEETTTTTAAGE